MNRSGFLKRMGGLALGIAVGRHIPPAVAAPIEETAAPIAATNVSMTVRSLTASGGLCAPLSPIYSLPSFPMDSQPIRDALPGFTAERGGVRIIGP